MVQENKEKPSHILDRWMKDTPTEVSKEAEYFLSSSEAIYLGNLRIRGRATYSDGILKIEKAVVEWPGSPEVIVYDEVRVINGAILFPIK